jgi:hypothetical protein
MARDEPKIDSRQLQGLKYFQRLLPLLRPLHDVGTERDRAGNRQLHLDEYCVLMLLSLFNPILRSVRALQQASQLKTVQKKLGCPRTSLGSFSEAVQVFDPQRLEAIVSELMDELPPPERQVSQGHFRQVLTAVDGSVVKTLASLSQAAYLADKNGKAHSGWRFHTHLEVDRQLPIRIDVTSALNSGKSDEKQILRQRLRPDCCYVMDRWFAEFTLFNAIVAHGSSYVCRLRDNSNLSRVEEERPLSAAAQQAGVMKDLIVRLGTSHKHAGRPDHTVRVILVKTTPHRKRGGRKGGTAGQPSDGILRIATNLLDVPAEVIASIFQNRWTIEIFFRFFKHVLGCKHLLSQDPVGIQIQAYCAIIACLLIQLWTGKKPSLRTYEMLCLYWMGWANDEELVAHLEKLKRPTAKS